MIYNKKDTENTALNKKNETLRFRKNSDTQKRSHRLSVHTTDKQNGFHIQPNTLGKTANEHVNYGHDNLRQGDILYVDLGQGEGSEERGIHPCYVVLNNLGIKHGPTLVVAPISSKIKKLPTHYTIHDYEKHGLEKVSQILFEQQRTIDKSRVKITYGVIGHIDFEVIMNELFMTYGFSVKTEKREDSSNELCIRRSIC